MRNFIHISRLIVEMDDKAAQPYSLHAHVFRSVKNQNPITNTVQHDVV
jgi:hypothetical protein